MTCGANNTTAGRAELSKGRVWPRGRAGFTKTVMILVIMMVMVMILKQ